VQIVDDIDKMGEDVSARGLHFDFRRRGKEKAARAESRAADQTQLRRSANKERFMDEEDDDDVGDDDYDDDGYGNG
jgi:hypothetical protein